MVASTETDGLVELARAWESGTGRGRPACLRSFGPRRVLEGDGSPCLHPMHKLQGRRRVSRAPLNVEGSPFTAAAVGLLFPWCTWPNDDELMLNVWPLS
jgi:hypothetical protein